MNVSTPDVSIILINWNSLELTTTAIRTLQKHIAGITYEVIVVDNGSTRDAGPAELARRFPTIRVIANSANRGFSAANNQGIAAAAGRHILLLNSDTEQIENAVGRAVGYMDDHQDVGVLGILHRNGDSGQTYQPSAARFPTPLARARDLIIGSRPVVSPIVCPQEGDVDWVTGSFFLIRRACFDEVGPLDEQFFVYNEDVDWCFQARRTGWKVRFWPGASMVHLGSSSATQLADKTFMLYRNELRYFRKNHSSFAVGAYYAAMSTRLTVGVVAQTGRWLTGRARLAEVRERATRLANFITARSDRQGLRSY